MADFKEYIARNGADVTISADKLERLLSRYEWFSTARIVREHVTGEPDSLTGLLASGRVASSLKLAAIDLSKLTERRAEDAAASGTSEAAPSTDDIIDKFLQFGDYRIVADEAAEAEGENIRTEAEFEDEDDLVSEELAEIYLSQGLKSEALAIYRKLSLRNTEKSIYFAEIIDKIENNN